MGFPFLAPLKEWIVDIFEERESNPSLQTSKMPFVVLTSPAKVLKSTLNKDQNKRLEELKNLVTGKSKPSKEYLGCILANNVNIYDNYQINETIIGYDFNGEPIKVEGEVGRKVSVPIIEGVEIDTDGANNTLKTARISVKCFTLKQLEMFELFFLKAGMHLLLEFGNTYLLKKSINKSPSIQDPQNPVEIPKIEEFLIPKNNYKEFIGNYIKKFYRTKDDEGISTYIKKVSKSLGTYDYITGKVTGYSYSVDEGGVYNINLEISQTNEMTLAIPIVPLGNNSSNTKQPAKEENRYSQWKQLLCSDLNLKKDDLDKILAKEFSKEKEPGKNEFFNWGKTNVKQSDETVSIQPYLSLRFIVQILCKYGLLDLPDFTINLPTININGNKTPYILINVPENGIISSSPSIIFPGKIPKIEILPNDKDKKKKKEIQITDANEIKKINEYVLELTEVRKKTTTTKGRKGKNITKTTTELIEIIPNPQQGYQYGNALNCFILYDEVINAWRSSFTYKDFLEQILSIINDNSYGLFELRYAAENDNTAATILDIKCQNDTKQNNSISDPFKDIYRFKPSTPYSIVKNFEFNLELSNFVAARTFFNNQLFYIDAKTSGSLDLDTARKIIEKNVYESLDPIAFTSSDGYYSINQIEVDMIEPSAQELSKDFNAGVQKQGQVEQTKPEEVNLSDVLKSRKILFKQSITDKTKGDYYIYQDFSLISNYVSKNILKNENQNISSVLTPIEVTITIDGISGLSCGEFFHLDGVPETYNHDGVFQITNVKHNITAEGWITIIEAQYRLINNLDK